VSQWHSTKSLSPSPGAVTATFFLPSARQKVLDKEVVADMQFTETSMSSVTLEQRLRRVFSRLCQVVQALYKAAVSSSVSKSSSNHPTRLQPSAQSCG
jgi:hypothetical protein